MGAVRRQYTYRDPQIVASLKECIVRMTRMSVYYEKPPPEHSIGLVWALVFELCAGVEYFVEPHTSDFIICPTFVRSRHENVFGDFHLFHPGVRYAAIDSALIDQGRRHSRTISTDAGYKSQPLSGAIHASHESPSILEMGKRYDTSLFSRLTDHKSFFIHIIDCFRLDIQLFAFTLELIKN